MTKAKLPPRSQPPSSRPPPPAFPAPRAPSPPSTQSPSQAPSSLAGHPHEALVADAAAVAAAAAAAKKKKKKGKAKKTDDGLESLPPLHPHGYGQSPSGPFTATAQAQADLLSTASELYRRMEADPQGIPDDDAYWTSLPAHLRTFIRNALPLGQLPASAQAVASPNDANSRQASTQAMIAVAQQLAQAAHASQRHLQQHPPGPNSHPSSAFSSVPFDPSVFADLALHPEQALPLHPHPNSSPNSPHAHHNSHNTITATNNSHLHHHHHHHLHRHQAHDDDLENALYSSAAAVPNPPPTRPPGEPLPAPVVLVNEYGEERGEFEDDYYSDEELDVHEAASLDGTRDGLGPLSNGTNGLVAPPSGGGEQTSTKKKNKKKKKKSGATDLAAAPPPPPPPPPLAPLLSPQSLANPKATIQNNAPTSNVNALHPASNNKHRTTSTAPPAPSSRAAGKQPMTFSSTAAGKAPAGGRHPTSANGIGHGHGHGHGAVAAATGGLGKRTASVAAAGHPGGPASVNGVGTGGVDRTQQQQQQQQQQPQQAPKVWSSSSAEEREKIKEFWLCLNDKERRSLLKVEKEAVLRRMKEQQKHLCSCRVCGRKRHAIEDELDVLYEAYYVELEQYASHQQQYAHSGGTIPPPPGPGPFPGSVALDSTGAVIGGNSLSRSSATARGATQTRGAGQPQPLAPTGKKVTSLPPDDDEGYDDEDLEDDEYEDDYDDEEDEEDDEDLDEPETKAGSGRRRPANATSKAHSSGDSFFNLGSSLTVKGGILTVADDLLRNDGQKFLEMMEQLAERRSIREDEVRAIVEAHELDEEFEDVDVDEEEEVDEEDEEGEEELVEEDDEVEDDEDPEARMEEGRRMFQIFAARMFEQRVLQAYREKIAQERQLQLLRELEAEDQAEKEKEAKKQKENQKKKDKKKQAKQQKEEERLRLESEKAAEAAAAKEKLEKQREAELKRQEEVRLKREAEKRAQLEEKIRKDEEKRKRQEEERARDAERERKKREKDEKARLERERRAQAEEVAKRTKEQREAEAAERKAREETGKKAEEALASSSSSSPTSSSPAHSAPSNKKIPTPPRPAAGAALSEANLPYNATSDTDAVSPPSSRSTIPTAPRSPASAIPQSAAGHRSNRVAGVLSSLPPSSPSPSGAHSRVAPTGPTPRPHPPPGVARPTSGGSNGPAPLAATSLSSLPAPPQGLPPRPTTSLVGSAPSSSHGHGAPLSAPSSTSLPRPPLAAPGGAGSSGLAAASAAPLSAGPHVSSTPSAVGLANGATTSPPTQSSLGPHPTAPGHQQHQQGLQQSSSTPPSSSPFAQPPQPQQQPPVGLASQQHMALPSPRYGSSHFGPPLRSPSASSVTAAAHGGPSPAYATYGPLGMPSMGNKAGVEALASASPGLSSATASLASLNLGALNSAIGGHQQPIGPPPSHSRTTSVTAPQPPSTPGGQLDEHAFRSSPRAGAIGRPSAIGPIGPIGRHRDLSHDDMGSSSNSRSGSIAGATMGGPIGGPIGGSSNFGGGPSLTPSSSHFGTGIAASRSALSHAKLPEGILGSSALGADDEVVEPQPRRTGHNSAIGPSAPTSSFFGSVHGSAPGGGGGGGGSVGSGPPSAASSSTFAGPSPWAPSFASSNAAHGGSSSNTAQRGASSPISNIMGGLTSPTASGLGIGSGSGAGGSGGANIGPVGGGAFGPSSTDPWSRAQSGWDRARFAFEQPSPGQQQQHDPGMASSFNLFGAPGSGLPTPSSATFRHVNERDRL